MAGAGWIWILLRARHAVTQGVMLTMLAERALVDIGTSAIYWLCFGQALLGGLFLLFIT